MLARLFTFILFLALPLVTFASEPKEMAEEFLQGLGTDKQNEAILNLFSTNSAAFMRNDKIEKLKLEISQMIKGGGKYSGADLIAEKEVGARLVGLTYMLRFNRGPIRFEFVFYKPDDRWMITKFSSRSSLSDDVVEAMRDEISTK